MERKKNEELRMKNEELKALPERVMNLAEAVLQFIAISERTDNKNEVK